jgi:site-specific DNA-cytosine methylase
MNVLSLFDGISCARVALDRVGIQVDGYFSSEIDRQSIDVSKYNYDDITQMGDICKLDGAWIPKIDILIGGSPCQGFSCAGSGFNFHDNRSKLFFEFVRILKEVKPKYFILENVDMKPEWRNIISNHLGVAPVAINSSLVSAQSRKRLYWANFPITLPKDKGLVVRDIIESTVNGKYITNEILTLKPNKRKNSTGVIKIGEIRGGWQGARVYSLHGKSTTLMASAGGKGGKTGLYLDGSVVRKLTPVEAERLQTLPDNYTRFGNSELSDTQRYKMLGNCFTVDVISHILSHI